ncbi:hypothetical protein E2562_031367 [Oryza meyeriana var. granulata]|uniref:Uncharacterized protein n=1 Tax=Oryza meyeriana var. granulata TaxID=110450 RepID=A0A6G1DQ60_9ORYZ|nr:hypothetical protein E2562_031367 [Oryza meyeriana var. granulata]
MASCGSLLLLAKRKKSGLMRHCFPDLVVCEPVTQRCKVIPRTEEMKYHHCLGVFLLDADHSMARFKVTCVEYQPYFGVSGDVGTVRVCVYREDVWNWSRYMKPNDDFEPPKLFEWYIVTQSKEGPKRGIHLHARDSLAGVRGSELQAIVNGNGDRYNVRVVILEGDTLRVVTWVYDMYELILEKSLHLVKATCRLEGYKEGYFHKGAKVVTVSTLSAILTPTEETWMVSVDLETIEVAECKYACVAYPFE